MRDGPVPTLWNEQHAAPASVLQAVAVRRYFYRSRSLPSAFEPPGQNSIRRATCPMRGPAWPLRPLMIPTLPARMLVAGRP